MTKLDMDAKYKPLEVKGPSKYKPLEGPAKYKPQEV